MLAAVSAHCRFLLKLRTECAEARNWNLLKVWCMRKVRIFAQRVAGVPLCTTAHGEQTHKGEKAAAGFTNHRAATRLEQVWLVQHCRLSLRNWQPVCTAEAWWPVRQPWVAVLTCPCPAHAPRPVQINRHATRADQIRQLLQHAAEGEEGSGSRSVARVALESDTGHALPVRGITVSLDQLAAGPGEAQGLAAGLLEGVPSLQFLRYSTLEHKLDIVEEAVTIYRCAGIRYIKHPGLLPEGRILRANPSFNGRPRFDCIMADR